MNTSRAAVASALLAIAFLTSCVSTKNVPLAAGDRAAMRGKTLVASRRNMPAFGVIKPESMALAGLGGAIGGAIAGGIAESQGKEQVVMHHLPIPEETITTPVQKNLVTKTGARSLPVPSSWVADDNAQSIAAQYRPADYVLDIRTTGWMGGDYPFTVSKYFIAYSAKMRLIEVASGRVIAEGFQSYQSNDKAHAPNFAGIYANDAAFLRAETKKGTDAAIRNFSSLF